MNRTPDVELVLREYLADDGFSAPDHLLGVVAQRIGRQPQRRRWRLLGRPFMNSYAKLAAAAAAVLIVGFVGWRLVATDNEPGTVPSPSPSATSTDEPTPNPLAAALSGTWVSAPSSCADQNAALNRAGYTAAQLDLAGWDAATCMDMTHGSVHEIRFTPGGYGVRVGSDGRLLQLADGEVGWDGYYVVVDADTVIAGDGDRDPYLTYQVRIDADELVIDLVDNQFPAVSEAELWGDTVAQTVIYESGPFTRKP